MPRTPGLIVPSGYSSRSELVEDLLRRGEQAGFSVFDAADFDEEALKHYGVKGMKWGVIRAKTSAVGKAGKAAVKEAYKPSKDAIDAQRYMSRAKLGGVRNLSNHEMQRVIRRMQLEQQYKDLYGERQWHSAGKKWLANFLTDVAKDVTTSWLRNPFASKSADPDNVRVRAWTTGQEFAGEIQSPNRRRAIGR